MPTLSDIWNPSRRSHADPDDVFGYVRSTAREIIQLTKDAISEDYPNPTNLQIAEMISADQIESASFANFESAPEHSFDEELLHCLIELAICCYLGVDESYISSQY